MTDFPDYVFQNADWGLIPIHMRGGIERYVMHGVPMGGFLTAIFANDFMEAAGRADETNQRALYGYASFLYNFVPTTCKGSYEAVEAWQKSGGINGQMKPREAGR